MQRIDRETKRWTKPLAFVVLAGVMAGGCSSAPASLGQPSYLGARDITSHKLEQGPAKPNVTAGKVLSAIAFERVTGLEVDPARLVQP